MHLIIEDSKQKLLKDLHAKDGIGNILKSTQEHQEIFQMLDWRQIIAETRMVQKLYGVIQQVQDQDGNIANH